jgi:hypothetical protein
MTGRTKSDALIRDIAHLFVKYKLRDWEPILCLLRDGGAAQTQIASTIDTLLKSARPSRSRQSSKTPGAGLRFSDARASILETLLRALRDRALLVQARDLREAYLQSGGKSALPKDRMAAVKVLLRHLDRLPNDAFADALEKIQARGSVSDANLADEYARWFNLIHSKSNLGS